MAAHVVTEPGTTPDPVPATAKNNPPGRRPRPKIFLHIGEPKTGTTFLQQVMWRNRAELAAQGVVLPGHHPQDHFRASQDLRGIPKLATDPAGSWAGEWEILARQAQQAPEVAVISHELFSAADAQQADRAVRSLLPAEVHVVLTVRDIATLLPAEWQETVKHRNARGWEDWLGDVIDRESPDADRRRWWFWRVHDTLAILGIWSRRLPAGHVHVITTPPRGSATGLLWQRFASLLGIDPGRVDLTRARPNASLGMPEIEFLRRLNQALPDEVPDWFYMWNVKEAVAHQALAARPRDGRLVLPASRDTWAKSQAEDLVAALSGSGYDLVGDLDELRPRPATGPAAGPEDQPAERVLDAAVTAAAALVVNQYRKAYPAAKPRRAPAAPPGWPGGSRRRSHPRRGSSGRCASSAAASWPCGGCASWPGGRWSVAGQEGVPRVGAGGGRGAPLRDAPVVIAVVVTYNRRELLLEALAAVHSQSRAPDAVFVVDNASTDETAAAVRAHYPAVRLAELTRNIGGAGGFAYGMALALAGAADLVWLMDDDTVPGPDALRALFESYGRLAARPPALVASRVLWTDGRPHPMNTPRGKPFATRAERRAAAAVGCLPIRSASFVSILVDAGVCRRRGLPQADYFLWNDDFEFTTRLLRGNTGLLCPASVATHKTATFASTDTDPGERFFYEVRNKIWTLRAAPPLAPFERVLYAGSTLRRWARTFARSRDRGTLGRSLMKGIAAGVRTSPRPTGQVLASAGLRVPEAEQGADA
jgi:GT2 family glycosyltransferase